MKNNITENKFPDIKVENSQTINKSYNLYSDIINQDSKMQSLSRNIGPQNIFYNIDGQDFNYSNEKDFGSYLYINSIKKKLHLNNLRLNTDIKSISSKKNINKSQYYLPVLMEKRIDKSKISLYNNKDIKNKNKIGNLKQPDLNLIKNNNIKNNNISLSVNTISNKHKKEQ